MQASVLAPRARTVTAIVAMSGLAPFLLALMACLPVPVGDPERSTIDPALTGVWQAPGSDASEAVVWILEPWDSRTWLSTWLTPSSADESSPSGPPGPNDAVTRLDRDGLDEIDLFKTWLATIAGRRFLVLEPKAVVTHDAGMRPKFWPAYAVKVLDASRIELRLVNEGLFDGVTTTADAEAIIKKHIDDPDLYGDPTLLLRVPTAEYERVEALLDTLDIGIQSD